jgi:hypothetical protein
VNRVDHRLLGSAWGLGYGTALHSLHPATAPLPVVLGCGAVAALTAGGRLSPDVDQYWRRRTVRTWSGGERTKGPGLLLLLLQSSWVAVAWVAAVCWLSPPMSGRARGRMRRARRAQRRVRVSELSAATRHRGVTHWWGAPAAAAAALVVVESGPGASWLVPWWVAWAALAGWSSHLAGDLVHGKTYWGQDGPGIPLAPWWHHVGVGWASDGVMAHVVAWGLAVPAGLALVGMSAGI